MTSGTLEKTRPSVNKERRAFAVRLGERVRLRREELGMTRDDLADKLGLSFGFVRDLEQGNRRPIADAALKVAAALQWTPNELFDVGDAPLPKTRGRGRPKKPDDE
jgi:transcriptional regulator with XRE-family HTH domain